MLLYLPSSALNPSPNYKELEKNIHGDHM